MINNLVAIHKLSRSVYPDNCPYNPSRYYPEYKFFDVAKEANYIYDGVRSVLRELRLDEKCYGKSTWNPLGEIIKPGNTVVIKPNFVLSNHSGGGDIYSIVTHPSVIRSIIDYCLIALKENGKIIVADAPQYNCNWNELMYVTKLLETVSFLRGKTKVKIEVLDLRKYWSNGKHFPSSTRKLSGDPKGVTIVDLGERSEFCGLDNNGEYYGAVYDREETKSFHSNGKHAYEISSSILSADVIINLPKLKVHKKVGVTLNQKNLVGICTNKNCLIHYTLGSPRSGGDQFPDGLLTRKQMTIVKFERWMYDRFLAGRTILGEYIHRFIYGLLYLRLVSRFGLSLQKGVRKLDAGNWHGNDSAWRMTKDLALIIKHFDKRGKFRKKSQRRLFSLIDGVIGGEGDGPLEPSAKNAGVLIGGGDFLLVDIVAARLMGFDPGKIMQFGKSKLYFKKIRLISNAVSYLSMFVNRKKYLNFKPHPGWVGYIGI